MWRSTPLSLVAATATVAAVVVARPVHHRASSAFVHLHRVFYRPHYVRKGPSPPRPRPLLAVSPGSPCNAMDQPKNNNNYEAWSKEDLVARIRQLEAAKAPATALTAAVPPAPAAATAPTAAEPAPAAAAAADVTEIDPKKTRRIKKLAKGNREFDFALHPKRRVAFLLSYFGWPYQGFAAQAHTTNTVEHHLFEALRTTRLVDDITQADYSRCGRTDKGVSATGNAVSLIVRSRVQPGQTDDSNELPYVTMLNRTLPAHIRVLAWAPVPDDFTARFSCSHRTYKYFFPALGLDIAAMREAAAAFVGPHDFRNFCKIDPAKPVRNYERTVLHASIEPETEGATAPTMGDAAATHPSPALPHHWYTLTIRGTAFLWHQIRCMVHVLLLVGQGSEKPSLIADLLDVTKHPAKPQYDLAPELPLVLWEVGFPGVQWRYSDSPADPLHAFSGLVKHLVTMYETHRIQTLAIDLLLKNLMAQSVPVPAAKTSSGLSRESIAALREGRTDGDLVPFADVYPLLAMDTLPWGVNGALFPVVSTHKKGKKHLPLLSRNRCDTVGVKTEKLESKKRRQEEAEAADGAAAAAKKQRLDDDNDE
ncbi:pseudouridine synthase deg1 [Blastocladiella emersonii ATCC 22665]|nr:pseudouridine synthase deg1 [Blastocladiella emersonii ATCC 22665]